MTVVCNINRSPRLALVGKALRSARDLRGAIPSGRRGVSDYRCSEPDGGVSVSVSEEVRHAFLSVLELVQLDQSAVRVENEDQS